MTDTADRESADRSMQHMMDVVVAMRHHLIPLVLQEDVKNILDRQRKVNNFLNHMRRLFGVFEWRYLFLPIGIQQTSSRYYNGDLSVVVHARQLHIFGVRVARWVTNAEYFRDVIKGTTVQVKRSRMRRRRKR